MTGNESTHDMQMVISSQWGSFFADLAQKYQGQPVGIEVDQDLLLDRPLEATVPLQGIQHDKHKGLVISTGSGAAAETHTVKAPNLVWAVRDEFGKLVAVEVIGQEGRNLILRLEP